MAEWEMPRPLSIHCGEAKGFAETLIKQLAASDSNRAYATTSLNEVIRQCNRVSESASMPIQDSFSIPPRKLVPLHRS
jgi:hypothetical protein